MATPQTNEAKSVGVWVRVSTDDQARGESPEVHEKRARMYAEARGWNVRELYRLDAVSGKAVIEHAEAKRMLADIRSGHITGLVFSKIARLARNTKELLEFADAFRAAGADMISLQEAIDTGSPAGRLFFTIIAAMAQWEREEIAARVQAAVPIRAKLGKHIGGAAPFGYSWVDKKLALDPKEGPVRALIYELFLEHRRKKAVARILNERGYRTRNGSKWSDTTVDRLVRDPTAKGVYRQNYTKTNDRTKSWELKPESEWVFTPVEPVVSEELWEACNKILDDRLGSRKKPSRENVHLFSGYAVCSCSGKMYVWAETPKYVCSACRNKIPVDDLEAVYRDQLTRFLVSPDEIAKHVAAANEGLTEREKLLATLEEEFKKLEVEDERLYQLYQAAKLTVDEFGNRHRPLADRRSQIEAELPRLQAQLDVMRISLTSERTALSDAADLSSRWDQFSRTQKRQLVEAITDSIVIGKDEITVNFLYLPPTPEKPDGRQRDDEFALPSHFQPYTPLSLRYQRPKPYPESPITLGEHLKKRRCTEGLLQRQAAALIGVTVEAYITWETYGRRPTITTWPKVIAFLGYDPIPTEDTLRSRIAAYRRRTGLTCKQVAERIGVHECTVNSWETDVHPPTRSDEALAKLKDLLWESGVGRRDDPTATPG